MAIWLMIMGPVLGGAIVGYVAHRAGESAANVRWLSALADVASRWGRDPLAKAVLDAVEESARRQGGAK